MTMMEEALSYAEAGFSVLPLVERKKIPLTSHGLKDATQEPEIIKSWWSKWPRANIGIATGKKSGGLFVIDCDIDEGKNGIQALSEWELDNDFLPETACSLTGRGGRHYLFRSEKEVKNKTGFIPGVDLRGEGGYIVAPPSIHENGKAYSWQTDPRRVQIAEADETVFRFINQAQEAPYEAQEQGADGLIESGSRVNTLVSLIGTMKGKGIPEDTIKAAVEEMNKNHCSPPLTGKELEREVFPALKNLKPGDPQYSIMPEDDITDLSMISMSDVEEKEMEWLIPDFIPKGVINIFAGDGGAGKTTIWCAIGAAISSGKTCFFEEEKLYVPERQPEKVIYFSSEDDPSTSLKKRLKRCGANMDNIITIPISDPRFEKVKFNSNFLEELISFHRPALLIFDPLQSFVPPDINMGYRNAMRMVLNPLIGYGEKYGTTFIILCHTNKRENSYGRNRVSDSSDIWDIARNVFIVGNTGTDNLRYMSHEKMNNAPTQLTTLFKIQDGAPVFDSTTTKTDCDFMRTKGYQKKEGAAKEEAEQLILDYLKDGEKESEDLTAYMKEFTSEKTISRAKAFLRRSGQISYKTTGFGGEKKTTVKLENVEAL